MSMSMIDMASQKVGLHVTSAHRFPQHHHLLPSLFDQWCLSSSPINSILNFGSHLMASGDDDGCIKVVTSDGCNPS